MDLTQFGGRLLDHDTVRTLYGSSAVGQQFWNFGWLGFDERTAAQTAIHNATVAAMPTFKISGPWQLDKPRYCLWKAYKSVFGKFLPYNHQLTGSCVGAGGGNMAKTLMGVATALGKMEYRELFWPYTYGKSRQRDGSNGQGEGSTGSSYAAAATEDGYVAFDEDPSLGSPPIDSEGWLTLTSAIEMRWSDGSAAPDKDVQIGRVHLIKAKAKLKGSADVVAGHVNGYSVTEASSFGLASMIPQPQGTPSVRLGKWDGSWNHQMYSDETWDHPTLGIIHRIGNNWRDVHGAPTGDEPPGGFYITAATMDAICQRGEVYAFSDEIGGFPARTFTWD